MTKFWSMEARGEERTDLYLLDEIAARESWFSDAVTPKAFKAELDRARGTLYVWLDSPGGDAFAGAAIHDMLREYSASGRGRVIAMVSLAASAASVIAMAADEIRISVVGTMMIHEPWSQPTGKASELRAVADVLDTVREAQVDAYARRTGQSREKIRELLEGPDGNGTYMNAQQAIELGFADVLMHEDGADEMAAQRALARARIASSLRREEDMARVILSGDAAASPSGWAQALKKAVSALEGDSALAGAVAAGIRAGLMAWDERGKDAAGEAEHDNGLEALLSAIREIVPEDEEEE